MTKFPLVILVAAFTCHCEAGNVLYVSPLPALSHYQMLEPLMLTLAERGHNVTVLSHYPQKKKPPNYTDIDLRGTIEPYVLDCAAWNVLDDILDTFRYGSEHCEALVSTRIVQDFIKSDSKFDLVFVEAFDSDCYLGFVKRFPAPYIVYSAMALPVWESDWIYNPTEVSYVPDHVCRITGRMNLVNRFMNLVCHLGTRLVYWYLDVRPSIEIVRKNFHVDVETLEDVKKNVSMFFLNSFFGLNGVRPYLPNVVELGGIHIKPPSPLPPNIEQFLEESTEGVILFSMGSMVKSHTLDPKVRDGLVETFRNLKHRVLWKWETELQDRPDNVMTTAWLPQANVLGHRNVKAFISHGGIHGLLEAVHFGVPVVGLPLYGDQEGNLKHLEAAGAAITVGFNNFDVERFAAALDQVLHEDRYLNNALRLSKISQDRPRSPLDTAIYWTEYVMRHQGAAHFRSGALELTWAEYLMLDVWLVCLVAIVLLFLVFHVSLKYLRLI